MLKFFYFNNERSLWALKTFLILGNIFSLSALVLLKNILVISMTIMSLGTFELTLDLILDWESMLFFISISLISLAVFNYSLSYMSPDTSKDRFFALLASFVVSMWILVFSGNFMMLLIGWDGLGVSSFLLVIYFQNKTSENAGLITILTNRVGDVLIMVSLAMMLSTGTLTTWTWGMGGFELSSLATALVITAAFTKSAQIPFSSWLPAAMAAPTPVSALVHSSTLVTAGIYMLLRFKDHLTHSFPASGTLMLVSGAATMVMAGVGGLLEDDFKKMVALSTLSQLGLMVCCLGLSCYQLAYFHLLVHAYFKALMFMATGSVIHSSGNYQDLRLISIPFNQSPWTSTILLVSNMSLMGMPFLGGFYSKDLMLEMGMSSNIGLWGACMFAMGTALTVLYSLRFLILSSGAGILSNPLMNNTDKDWKMFSSYDMLFFLALAGGSLLNYAYLVYPPVLMLTPELKNSIIILILSSWIMYSSGLTLPKFIHLKWTLGLMLGLTLISPNLAKQFTLTMAYSSEKYVEQFFAENVLFKLATNSMMPRGPYTSQNMATFWLSISLMLIIMALFLSIEMSNLVSA